MSLNLVMDPLLGKLKFKKHKIAIKLDHNGLHSSLLPHIILRFLCPDMFDTVKFLLSHDVAYGIEITPSGLQIFRKRYDVHNNVAYILTIL